MIRTPDWGETRRLQLASPETVCQACGHMLAQHMKYDAEKIRHTTGCEWTTCGCPAFVESDEAMTAATEAPGMVTIRQDDLEHLLDWHNKPCGDAEDAGMFERLLAAIPREADDAT